MTKNKAKAIRGREICFTEFYFYPWLDNMFPEMKETFNPAITRRISMALATLSGASAKAIEEIIQTRYISVKDTEDIAWKTEHNIYPHHTTLHEKVHCMEKAECPASRRQRRIFNNTLTIPQKEAEFINNEPTYYGKDYYYGPIFHKEHWIAIELLMLLADKTLITFPLKNHWTFDMQLIEEAENGKNI